MFRWLQARVLGEKKIDDRDLAIMRLTDDPEEAAEIVSAAYRAQQAFVRG